MDAIQVTAGGSVWIENSGTIRRIAGSASVFELDNAGDVLASVNLAASTIARIVNTGSIFGFLSVGSADADISNFGLITGSIISDGGSDVIYNHGQVGSGIGAGASDDVIDTRSGTVTGGLFGGAGHDT